MMDINPKPFVQWDGAPLQHCQFDPRCECSALHNDRKSIEFRRPLTYLEHPKCTCQRLNPKPVMQYAISVNDWLCRECGNRSRDVLGKDNRIIVVAK